MTPLSCDALRLFLVLFLSLQIRDQKLYMPPYWCTSPALPFRTLNPKLLLSSFKLSFWNLTPFHGLLNVAILQMLSKSILTLAH
jgi:hypothetical protein